MGTEHVQIFWYFDKQIKEGSDTYKKLEEILQDFERAWDYANEPKTEKQVWDKILKDCPYTIEFLREENFYYPGDDSPGEFEKIKFMPILNICFSCTNRESFVSIEEYGYVLYHGYEGSNNQLNKGDIVDFVGKKIGAKKGIFIPEFMEDAAMCSSHYFFLQKMIAEKQGISCWWDVSFKTVMDLVTSALDNQEF